MKKALVKTALILVDIYLRINIRIIPFREIPLGIQLNTIIEEICVDILGMINKLKKIEYNSDKIACNLHPAAESIKINFDYLNQTKFVR